MTNKMLDFNCALIDNDFLTHAIETRMDEKSKYVLLNSIFDVLNKTPMIHPWISNFEVLWDNQTVNDVISNTKIQTATWDDIHGNRSGRIAYYEILFKELFKKIHGTSFGAYDVFSYCVKKQSLGELHNIAACIFCDCNLILSDDKDTKRFKALISQSRACNFEIYTRSELVERIRGLEGAPKRSDLKSFAHKRV